jgi:predicted alpha/beta-hydrolase family hydrolase
MSRVDSFDDRTADPPVRGFLTYPDKPNGDGLVLTHGAGSNSRAPMLIALSEAFAEAGFTVLRVDLPFRQARSFGPPRPGDAARDREGLCRAADAMRKVVRGRVFLGGQSYGGRQASMLAADEPKLVDGLLLLSYPLHAPGRPDQLRTQHLPKLRVPVLFIEGTKDPFGTIEEIEAARKLIPSPTRIEIAEGAGHDLGFKAKAKSPELPAKIVRAFGDFFRISSQQSIAG